MSILRSLVLLCTLLFPVASFHRLIGTWKPVPSNSLYNPTIHLHADGRLHCITSVTEITCRVRDEPHDDCVLVIDDICASKFPPIHKISWGDIKMFLAIRASTPLVAVVVRESDTKITVLWKFQGRSQSIVLRRIFCEPSVKTNGPQV